MKDANFNIFVVDNSPFEDVSVEKIIEWAKGNLEIKKTNFPRLIFPLIKKPIDFSFYSESDFYKSSYFKKLNIIKSNENKGFAAANNIVLRKILGGDIDISFIWLLNNDTIVEKESLFKLVESVFEEKLPAIRGCLIRNTYPSFDIQSVGLKYKPVNASSINITSEDYIIQGNSIDYVMGASFFVNKDFLKTAGIIPEEYFLYYEELSWIKKVTEGISLKTTLESIIYHKGGASTKSGLRPSLVSDFYAIRNKLVFTKNYYPQFYLRVRFRILLIVFKRVLKGDFKRALLIFKILIDHKKSII